MARVQHHLQRGPGRLHRVQNNMFCLSVVSDVVQSLVERVEAIHAAATGVKRPADMISRKGKRVSRGKKVRKTCKGEAPGLGPDMSVKELDYFFGSFGAVPGDISEEFCDPFSWDVLSSGPVCVPPSVSSSGGILTWPSRLTRAISGE